MLSLNLSATHSNQITFSDLNAFIKELCSHPNALIITEKNIQKFYPNISKTSLPSLILSISEKNKTLSTAQKIWNFLIQNNITKSHTIYIIGGGVLHDVCLFACSVFKRGLNIISVPTTLLAMTDASIGGKNAVNYQHIKNLIGNIYLPQKNIIITDFLQTLPKKQLISGWAEILKIALVSDTTFYEECVQYLHQSLIPNQSIIKHAIQLKINIIQNDLYDQNTRQLLNFGHTIAHAIEAIYDEQKKYLPHGIAVAQGMMIEAYLAHQLNLLPSQAFQKIFSDLKAFYPLPKSSDLHPQKLLNKILQDKKNTSQNIHFTLPENIGKGKIKVPVDKQTIIHTLEAFHKNYLP